MTASKPLTEAWLDKLFDLPGAEHRLAYIQHAQLLNAEGLSRLLDQAMQYARADPRKARFLASVCTDLAQAASAPEIVPRALYVRAQTHAINGEFSFALELIQSARTEYEAIGDPMSALRTNLGKMHILNELGRHQEALEAGEETLRWIDRPEADSPQAMIAALAHMNQGVCYETLGRYEEALTAYGHAEDRFTKLGMQDRLGDVYNNRGIVLVHLGRVSQALETFERALAIWKDEGLTLLQAQTLSNIGEAHLASGNYTRGLNAFEQARALFEPMNALADHSILLRKTADAYLALNLFPEAVTAYWEANKLLEKAGMTDHHARALWGMGTALVAQSQYEEASRCLDQASDLFEAAGNIPMTVRVALEQAALQEIRGNHTEALETSRAALNRVEKEKWPVEYLYANMRQADLLLPDADAAEPYLASASAAAEGFPLPVIQYCLHSRLGHLRRLQGRSQDAQTHLEKALSEIETLRGNLIHEATRTSFLQDKTAVYDDLIRIHLDRGDEESLGKAFEVSEGAKSRTLADLLAGVVSRESNGAGEALFLHTLRADLSAAYNRFFEADDLDADKLKELHVRIAQLEQEISQARLRSASRVVADPFVASLPLENLRAEAGRDHPMLCYHLLGDEILVFYINNDKIRVIRNIGQVSEVQNHLQRLNAQWDQFLVGGEFVRRNLEMLERSTRRVLESLFGELFSALTKEWGPTGIPPRLTLVPHGILHQVPFHALFDGETYLLDQTEIAYAPSAAVYVLCAKRERRTPRRGVVVGLADFRIPAVDVEAQTVVGQLAQSGVAADLLLGEAATRGQIQAAAETCDVIHLACHGLFRSDNPMFSALKLADGWLTAADVMQFQLKDALVALSACESGRSRILQSDEVIGFPRAFLSTGASSVLVSLWLVQDETTAALMGDWYKQMGPGVGRAEALRMAQQNLREKYPHPYYWAPFVLIGQR
jgi:CHAT domain-containing protein/tetratricopeptide (TPR) repeat protein